MHILQFAIAAIVPAALVFTLGDDSLHVIIDRMTAARLQLIGMDLPVPGSLDEYIDEGNAGTLAAGGVLFGIGIMTIMYEIAVTLIRFHQTCFNDFPNCFILWVSVHLPT